MKIGGALKKLKPILFWSSWFASRPILSLPLLLIFLALAFYVDGLVTRDTQWLIGLFCWWVLLGALHGRTRRDRWMVLSFVVLATIAECTFSLLMGWYTYRLNNIPPWVPPGHGIVFLAALTWSRTDFIRRNLYTLQSIVIICMLAYALAGMAGSHPDIVGAVASMVFVVWLLLTGEARSRFYIGMALLVCYLEVVGIILGAWQWSPYLPGTSVPEGNPPSGVVGVYGVLDLAIWVIIASVIKPAHRKIRHHRSKKAAKRAIIATQ